MKILTIGLSPFYFTRNSKIHNSLIQSLSDNNDVVLSSIFLEHDIEYFTQDSIRQRYGSISGTFYSTCEAGDSLVTSVFDIVEKESPDTIITVGAFSDLEYMRAIKRVIPGDFNWVVVLTSNIGPQVSSFLDTLTEADSVICLTNQSHQALLSNDINSYFFKYGPEDVYFKEQLTSKVCGDYPVFMVNDKNVQQSNLAVVLDVFSQFVDYDFKLILHTNYYESGDYDLDHLISKFKPNQIEIPDNFVGLKEGCSDDEMIEKYFKAHFFIDLSIKPVTSLCAIEAATQGCVPIINKCGVFSESIAGHSSTLGLDDFLVSNNVFFGEYLEPFYIASQDVLFDRIHSFINLFNQDIEKYSLISKSIKSASRDFSCKGFCRNVSNSIVSNNDIGKKKGLKIKIETF